MNPRLRNFCARKAPGIRAWVLFRRVAACEHTRLCEINLNTQTRPEAAAKLRMARASMRQACQQQLADINDQYRRFGVLL